MKRSAMERLAEEIQILDKARRAGKGIDEDRLNATEARFFALADVRGKEVYRHGWPDFLLIDDGQAIGVEVKTDTDAIRPSQSRMFEALERSGAMHVYVWCPRNPDALTPWRRFYRLSSDYTPMPRQRVQGRIKGWDRG